MYKIIVLLCLFFCLSCERLDKPPLINKQNMRKNWYGLCDESSVYSLRSFFEQVIAHNLGIYYNLPFNKVRIFRSEKDQYYYVSYIKERSLFWTKNKILVKKGEILLAYEHLLIRGYCCNQLHTEPQIPVSPHEPPMNFLQPKELPVVTNVIIQERITTTLEKGSPPLPPVLNETPTMSVITQSYNKYVSTPDLHPVPEPSTILLFTTGLFSLVLYKWRKNK